MARYWPSSRILKKKSFENPSVRRYYIVAKITGTGFSSKILKVLINLYTKASIRVKGDSEISKRIEITEGVFQAETYGPVAQSYLQCLFK